VSEPHTRLIGADSLVFGGLATPPRRRRGIAAVAAVLVLALAALALSLETHRGSQSSERPGTIAADAWAASLPLGRPAAVPYLAGTDAVLPGGSRVAVGGAVDQVVGLASAGLVVRVGTVTPEGYPSGSRYVLVTGGGEVRDLPIRTRTADGGLEALVSPDGRYLAAGHDVLDLADLARVDHLPRAAAYLLWWTPAGILYAADDGRYFLWSAEHGPRPLGAFPGSFKNGTDIGIKHCSVVKLTRAGRTTPLSTCIHGVRSVSPSGRWALTRDLHLVEVASGRSRALTPAPLDPLPGAYEKVWWDGESSLVLPIGPRLVRCATATARCERASDPEPRAGGLSLP